MFVISTSSALPHIHVDEPCTLQVNVIVADARGIITEQHSHPVGANGKFLSLAPLGLMHM